MANRKRNRQVETNGLIITKALYGSRKALKKGGLTEVNDELAFEVIDVTVPLNFLVNDSGQLKVCFFQFYILLLVVFNYGYSQSWATVGISYKRPFP